ncbi:hypothetical protein [Nonomuraea sp. NPDC049129]|uniref:hypothetical protein n=1 Tax=Nonomuraea sp. NPDC049129 TaxID=3155272 RepID=UPI0033DC1435
MEGLLLSIHVLAGIVFVGGSAIAASLFPRYAPVAVDSAVGDAPTRVSTETERNRAVALALHRVTRGYGLFGIVVPVVGIAAAMVQGRIGEIWISVSMTLLRTLRLAAAVELVSLVVLLGNLLTTHTPAVATLVGPLHGTAYLVIVVTALLAPAALPSGVRWRAVIPGVGGLLVVRRMRNHSPETR